MALIVYRHIRLDKNVPFYIGIGTRESRAYDKWRNKYWRNIVAKTPYEVEILFFDLSREQAEQKEREFIALYGRLDLKTGTLANLTNGGDEGGGQANKGRKHTEETKAKLKGRIAPSKSPEVRKKLSERFKGRPISEEQKKKISNTLKGRSNGPWKQSQREKNLEFWLKQYKPINQYDLNGNFIKTWDNRIEASIELNIKKEFIRNCLRGKRKSINGFIFQSPNTNNI